MDKSIVDIKIITLNRIITQLRYKPLLYDFVYYYLDSFCINKQRFFLNLFCFSIIELTKYNIKITKFNKKKERII
jgi:hypothetical protein